MRRAAVEFLGGKCVDCGETKYDELEFDHEDASTKTIQISQIWGRRLDFVLTEVRKCVLRCLACHAVKDGRLVRDKWGDFKREQKTSINHRYSENN